MGFELFFSLVQPKSLPYAPTSVDWHDETWLNLSTCVILAWQWLGIGKAVIWHRLGIGLASAMLCVGMAWHSFGIGKAAICGMAWHGSENCTV